MTEIIENPIAVINTLQARIAQLECALKHQSEDEQEASLCDGLKRLRFHGVIPLFVGHGDLQTLHNEMESLSPSLIKAFNQVWPLKTSVLSEATKKEIQVKAKNGMDRWS